MQAGDPSFVTASFLLLHLPLEVIVGTKISPMIFIKYEGKEIPYEGAWRNPDFVAYMKKVEEEHWLKRGRHWNRLSTYSAVCSTVVAICAAIVAVGSLYEAHQSRVADERPFVSVEVPGPQDSMGLHSSGKMPALHIEAVCFIEQNEARADWNRVAHPLKTDLVFKYVSLVPGQTDGIPCMRSAFSGKDLVRYGVVKYVDFEGNQYQTPFCYMQYSHESEDEINTEVHGCTGAYGRMPDLK